MRRTPRTGPTGSAPTSACAATFLTSTPTAISPANSGNEWDGIVSPKVNLIFGPWHETEFYLNYGLGFHSNDARGVNNTVDPTSLERLASVTPLVRTQGAEFGIRSQAVRNLTSTLALFWLRSDSELVYVGDAGLNEPGPASERFGVEWSNYWRPSRWLGLDAEVAATRARFLDSPGADRIPDSVPLMFSGGVTVGAQGEDEGFFGTLRARAFAQRPLVEDNSVKGKSSFLVNAAVGYRRKNWEAVLECLNLFDREDNDIEYYYASRLPGEAARRRRHPSASHRAAHVPAAAHLPVLTFDRGDPCRRGVHFATLASMTSPPRGVTRLAHTFSKDLPRAEAWMTSFCLRF